MIDSQVIKLHAWLLDIVLLELAHIDIIKYDCNVYTHRGPDPIIFCMEIFYYPPLSIEKFFFLTEYFKPQ